MAKSKLKPENNTVIQQEGENKPQEQVENEHTQQEEEEEEKNFEELGIDPRLIRALSKKSIEKPTPIQRAAIPLILVNFAFLYIQIGLYFHFFSLVFMVGFDYTGR